VNTRRYPRTLQEAFGPYTDRVVHEPVSRRDRIGGVLLAVAMGVAAAALLVWRLAA
jgi:hypothetical protein